MKQFVLVFFLCIRLCMIQGKDCPNPFQTKEYDSKKEYLGTKVCCPVKCIDDKHSCLGIEFKDGKCFLQKSYDHNYLGLDWLEQPYSSFLIKVLASDNKLTEFRNPGRVWVSDEIVS